MGWPLLCRCVCLHRKDQGDSLSDILHIFPPLCLAPLLSKWYICIYRCSCLSAGGKCLHVCKSEHLFLFHPAEDLFPTPSLFFQSIIRLPYFFSIPPFLSPRSCRKCNHVRGGGGGVKSRSTVAGKEGARRSLRERGEEKEKGICMCTQLPLRRAQSHLRKERMHARSENSYFYPASSARVFQWWWGRLNNIMALFWSGSSGLIKLVSLMCVIAAQCAN